VLVERATGAHHAIDLNPRGFGQMTLDMAVGHNLPRLWYTATTGEQLTPSAPPSRKPVLWHDGVSSTAGLAAGVARGPARWRAATQVVDVLRAPKVGATFERSDPLPGVLFGLGHLRHPRAFLRQFFVDVDCATGPPTRDEQPPTDALAHSA
jgi:hypothetical protein